MPDSRPNLIAERYRLVGQIGQGGMGRVWSARDELLGRDVAVKELVPSAGLTEPELHALRERTIREARAIAMLDHPNVVRIFDVVFHGGEPWIVMELVPSRSLFDTVRDEGPMPPERVARVGLGVLAALRAAHRVGLLHRDVKPGNVLLAHDGRVVLTDFGLATAAGDASMTSTGIVLGSPQYLAPERALDAEVGPPADLWSLGATLYAAVEGRPPYVRSSPMATLAALATELPAPPERCGPLRHALTALLQRDPARRADADTAQRLLLAATSPAAPPPADLPRYDTPTFAVPHQRTPAPVLPPAPAGVPAAVPATGPADPLAVLAPSPTPPADPPAVLAPSPTPPAGPPVVLAPPAAAGRSGSTGGAAGTRRRVLVGVAAVALVVVGGLLAYPMMSTESTADPQPELALVVPSPGEAGGVGSSLVPSVPVKTSRPRSPAPSGHPASAGTPAKTTEPTAAPVAPSTAATTTAAAVSGRRFVSHGTGTCLYAPGTTGRIQSWACNDDAGERFTHPSDGTLRVRDRCVQIAGTGDGATLDLAACTGARAQQWNYNESYDLVNLWAVKCVDIPDASSANGVVVQIWECSGASHQKWDY
ncbi:protein kinase domain-containing protein [Actinoplanes subglobosus]|uniref:non-specific serine/threonine protein kinase n=1 Tax=Actinoplanes subglobosus TaxID=1547892 RepID=A0ABV8IT31_9ACTN